MKRKRYINQQIGRINCVFKWAASEERGPGYRPFAAAVGERL